jgi:hypothetical protein
MFKDIQYICDYWGLRFGLDYYCSINDRMFQFFINNKQYDICIDFDLIPVAYLWCSTRLCFVNFIDILKNV